MKHEAEKLRIFGWVKNTSGLKVEAIIEGEKDNILKLIEWARTGPAMAKVDNVAIDWQDYKGEFNSFIII